MTKSLREKGGEPWSNRDWIGWEWIGNGVGWAGRKKKEFGWDGVGWDGIDVTAVT